MLSTDKGRGVIEGRHIMEQVMSRISIPRYTLGEELINSISHGFGALMSVVALVMMLFKASGPLQTICALVFGVTMIVLYSVSCLYHALPPTMPAKKILRVIDHCNVYLLVFGTYVPAALIGVGSTLGWVLFGIVALFTVAGITFAAIDVDRFNKIQVVCHLVCGWSFVAGMPALIANYGVACGMLVVAGGIAYSVGAALYGLGKHRPYMHSVFHFFCLAGTFFHFLAIYGYLL